MPGRPITSLFGALLEAAEKALARPSLLAAADELAAAQLLAAEVRQAADKLAAPQLVFEEEALLADVLVKIMRARRDHDDERLRLFAQIAGVLVPVVREHAHAALVAQAQRRPATSDQDYQPKRG
ncbi:MAG TPA: hypothetical protein VNK91_02350 [Burkholderiaceae bacterium]|nr:hypothetical protein [Burkholderiaceae bacterium]